MNFSIRKATKTDLPEVLSLVKELALYENAPKEVTITLEELENDGFNGVVLTVIKEIQELSKTVTDGGHYSGGNYYGFYPRYYGGFRGYYYNPLSYSTLGVYEEETSTTYSSKNYVLETVVYNLDESDEKQLVSVVTSKIEDPENATKTAKQYVKAITASLNNK